MSTKIAGFAAFSFLLLAASATHALALDRHVLVINATSYTIREFYASNVGASSWQEDILGDEVLQPGDTINVNVDDASGYCKYDFRAVFDDGTEATKRAVNVCEVVKFTFTD